MNRVIDATFAVVIVGSLTAAGVTAGAALAGEDNEIDTEVYSFDAGSHVARVWAFCFGGNGIYMVGDTDQFQVLQSDEECNEGGVLDG